MRKIMKATAKDLRFHSKEILDTVSRGEEVIITFRGKPQAKLVPIEHNKNNDEKNSTLFGIWKNNDRIKNVDDYLRKIRKGRFQ